ncbi:MAG TPA: hypothetical protein VID77_10465 [Stellaceae bacterium]|jgi:hypothetical protein
MPIKFALIGIAVAAALAIGAPAFAADNDMSKPAKPMHHKMMHHKAMHHAAAHHEMHARHHMHGAMGVDAKERAETQRLNQEQLTNPGK